MSTLGQVDIFVRDMTASVEFYRLLGLDLPDPYEWPVGSGGEHVSTDPSTGCHLALDNHPMAHIWNNEFDPDRGRWNVVIGLSVGASDHVNRTYERVRAAGHPVGQAPYDAFFGSRYAIVIDPDGNQVGLKSSIDPGMKYEPEVG